MTDSIFTHTTFTFPYRDLKFPGQHSEEHILFVCREGSVMLKLRQLGVLLGTLVLIIIRQAGAIVVRDYVPDLLASYRFLTAGFIAAFTLLALTWVYLLWRKSVFIITTRRLTKFIHTTPWNRYQLSLGLDKIVDTASYQKGLIQSLFHLGYFVARSSAGNIKNFKIINISYAEDLQNYVNKLLFVFNKQTDRLDSFRPFVPHLKGQARVDYVKRVSPEFYQDR